MSSEWDQAANVRIPLPSWWLSADSGQGHLWSGDGARFAVYREGAEWPCLIPYSVLERLAGKKLNREALEKYWALHADDFRGAAIRAVRIKNPRKGRTVILSLADLMREQD